MNDLQARFRTLDRLEPPDLWREVEVRAAAPSPQLSRPMPWVLIAAMLLLTAALGGALVVAGVVRLPPPDTAPSPSAIPSGDFGWTGSAQMAAHRENHTATLLASGHVLVVGGDLRGSAEIYDPAADVWRVTALALVEPVNHTATLLADGSVLVAGGSSISGISFASAMDVSALFDPVTGSWSAAPQMNAERASHTATLLQDGRVLVAGGDVGDGANARSSAELFDPVAGTWTRTGSMTVARTRHAATVLHDGRVLVTGGSGRGDQSSAEVYDPETGTWAAVDAMQNPREGHTATLLADGTVLVVGGCIPTAERFDPAGGTWSTTAGPGEPRTGHTASLMTDGQVLVVGGYGCGTREPGSGVNGSIGATELYDPALDQWAWAGDLATNRVDHDSVQLDSGAVLVIGGYQGGGNILDSTEMFAPNDAP